MKLSEAGLKDRAAWEEKGYRLPQFDREAVTANTHKAPFWIHFGAGNIFRAFQANAVQNIGGNPARPYCVPKADKYIYTAKMKGQELRLKLPCKQCVNIL